MNRWGAEWEKSESEELGPLGLHCPGAWENFQSPDQNLCRPRLPPGGQAAGGTPVGLGASDSPDLRGHCSVIQMSFLDPKVLSSAHSCYGGPGHPLYQGFLD